jgi:uncharacterized protein DUF3237
MELVEEFTFQATIDPPLAVGAGPRGTRLIAVVTGGKVSGERISGEILGGGDWVLVDAEGFGAVDVRLHVRTDDGALLYLTYTGVVEFTDAVNAALAEGRGTEWGDQYLRVTPRIEAGDPRYAWVNHTVFVGEARMRPGLGVEYRVFRVA